MNTTNHTSPSGEELKPCPFCGGAAELQEYEEVDATRWAALVRCTVCGVDGKRGYANNRMGCFDAVNGLHKQSAIAGWNRRAQPIGEDAANGAIGEREAFFIHRNVLKQLSSGLDQVDTRVYATQPSDRHVAVTRAALTAEKAAAEPVAPVGGREAWEKVLSFSRRIVSMLDTTEVMRSTVSGTAYDAAERAVFIRNLAAEALAAPQQPAQSAEQDEREIIRELQKALFYWMPRIAGEDSPAGQKAAEHSYLLVGLDDNSTECWGDQILHYVGTLNREQEKLGLVLSDAGCTEDDDYLQFIENLAARAASTQSTATQPSQTQVALTDGTRKELEAVAKHPYGGKFAVYMSGDEARALLAAQPVIGADHD